MAQVRKKYAKAPMTKVDDLTLKLAILAKPAAGFFHS